MNIPFKKQGLFIDRMTIVVEGDLEVFFVQHKFVESNLRNC